MADAQGRQQVPERPLLGSFDRRHEVVHRDLAPTVELQDIGRIQVVDVTHVLEPSPLDEVDDRLVSETLDVHATPGREVEQALDPLGRTIRADAIRGRLALSSHDVGTARGTLCGHLEHFLAARPFGLDRSDHLRDHVAGPPDDDGVADQHALARDLVFVVQGRGGHGHSAHEDRFQLGPGGGDPGATHVDLDVFEEGGPFLRRELVCDRPPGSLCRPAELVLLRDRVDLHDDTVDLVGNVMTVLLPVATEAVDLVQVGHLLVLGIGPQPPLPRRRQRFGVGLETNALDIADAVTDEREVPPRRDLGVLLAQGPGRSVARVGEGL